MPVLSTVFVESEIVGFGLVDHTTPRAVTAETPSDVIFPPPTAVLVVIPLMAIVVTVGILAVTDVVNVIKLPYAVPELFTA